MSRRITAGLTAAALTLTLATAGATGSSTPGKQPPQNQAPPAVSGSAKVPNTLTASTGAWTGKALKYAYQWLRCDSGGAGCSAISGASSSSDVLSIADVGHTLRVIVTATNRNGSAAATSAQTAVVVDAPSPPPPPPPPPPPATVVPPSNTSLPTISGTTQQGQTLNASAGSWSGTTPISYAYQWQRCDSSGAACAAIAGATSTSYSVGSAEVGSTLRVSVTASNSAGSTSASSMASYMVTATVQPPGTTDFATGFESPFSMDARSSTSNAQDQFWHSGDKGYNFDTYRYQTSQVWSRDDIGGNNPPPGYPPCDYICHQIATVTGPRGSSTKVDKISEMRENPNGSVQQAMIQTAPLYDHPIPDYYMGQWLYINPEAQSQATSRGSQYWRMFWGEKDNTNYRMNVTAYNYTGTLKLRAQADTRGWCDCNSNVVQLWHQDQTGTLPIGKWFYLEVMFHRATDSSGRFAVGINGNLVIDYHGSTEGNPPEPAAIIAHATIYSNYKHDSYQYVDDLVVRDFAPCAAFPCGPVS
jgi:hypothetical protein